MAGDVTVARRPVLDGPADYAIFALIVAVVVAVPGVYVTGELAGLITHLTLPKASLGQVPKIIRALPHHWGNPKLAWPASARPDLPGPVGFGIAAAVVLTAMCWLGIIAAKRAWRGRSYRGFASRQQIGVSLSEKAVLKRGPVVRPSVKGVKFTLVDVGVRIGWADPAGIPVAISIEDSVLMLAPPRQGKSSQCIIPWLHGWRGPAIVTSARTDVLENTATIRAEQGPVLVMAPTGMVAWPDNVQWAPLADCEDFDKAILRAEVMVTVGKSSGDNTGGGDNKFFGLAATNLMAGWLHAAAISGRPMTDVLRWAFNEGLDEPVHILGTNPKAAPDVAEMLDNLYRAPADTTRSNLWTTVQTAVAPLLSVAARATFAPEAGATFDIEDFLRSNGTIYILVPKHRAKSLAPLVSAFFDEVIETAKRLADDSTGGRLDAPLAILGDEIANVSPLPQLPDLISYSGGSGIFMVMVLQDMAQAIDGWGPNGAAKIWGAATVKIALGGLSGDELDDLSKLGGEYRESLTTHQHGSSGYSMQTTLLDRKTISPEQIRTLSSERREALVIHATTPAVKVRMQRHYEGPHAAAFATAVKEARAIITEEQARRGSPETAQKQEAA
ncbi:conjugative transfer gene complex protein [Catenulispora acidiphila DSM 44928]|uniref:Conjugative transfer gene complex protein n=1 Tax=Catenulispora acidiphila (strain DSM 44928 / JCM 14897 / NBRC 102108 / NRRL B-24433 / ID139908) TaxID=479433 RepID=C7Q3Z7_CATAD|nr:type IV secretory system conjugative DNA transfer family protein [Catenulispora acidiphila]ACU77755.1 conjugative transfer gene complex protein [Catenulispora acidiphila DSM 44928]